MGAIIGAWRHPSKMSMMAVTFSALKWGLIIGAILTILWGLIEKSFAWHDQPVDLLVIWALAGAIAGVFVFGGYEAQKYTGKYYYDFKDFRISMKKAFREERRSIATVIVGSAIIGVVFAYILVLK